MTIGGVERSAIGFEKLVSHMTDRHYTSVRFRSKVLENTGHSGTKNETYSRGLQYVFERPSLKLDAAGLNKYVGTYELADGYKVEIKNENNSLALYLGNNNKYQLYAAGEADFYSVNEFLNIHFKNNNAKVEGFQLDQYGGTQFIKKTN